MKPHVFSLLLLSTAVAATPAAPGFNADAFSPERWPGQAPDDLMRQIRRLASDYAAAMNAGDAAKLAATRNRIVALLGPYAGVPEERPAYGTPVDSSAPAPEGVQTAWTAALALLSGRTGWEEARKLEGSPGAGGRVPRLRVSERQIRALLQTHEAGLDPNGAHLKAAIAGLDYLLTTQASTGVFGYPYEPGGAGLRQQGAEAVARGRKQGLTMVERDWIIEDLGSGGLNFDNGVCGAVLLHGYALTGDARYLAAAIRAGEWAKKRPLALNFNYNGFSGILLARLYRATGERAWLEAAQRVFEFGVLDGQMPNGRWFDQHNAKIQYHAILCSQTLEYLLALRHARHDTAPRVERQARLALDNLAAELTTYGTNNADEALSLSALAFGLMIIGPEPAWHRAADVATNYLTGPFAVDVRKRGRGAWLPEPVACWLLEYAVRARAATPVEVRPALVPPPRR